MPLRSLVRSRRTRDGVEVNPEAVENDPRSNEREIKEQGGGGGFGFRASRSLRRLCLSLSDRDWV